MSGLTSIINFDDKPVSAELLSRMTEQVAFDGAIQDTHGKFLQK